MHQVVDIFMKAADRPIEAIQLIISIGLLLLGLYTMSPFYISLVGGSASAILYGNSILVRYIIAIVLYTLPALPITLGLFFKSLANAAMYRTANLAMFVSYLFLTIGRLITVGPRPLIWIFTLLLALIAAICRLYWKADLNA